MKVNKRKLKKIFLIIISVILLISIYLNTYLILKYNVLPTKYLIIYFILAGVIPITLIGYTLFKKRKSILKKILIGIEIIYIIILFLAFFYLNKTFNFLDDFTSNYAYETKNYYVLVNKDTSYEEIEDLKNKSIGYSNSLDESIGKALKKLDEKLVFENKEYTGFTDLFAGLYNNEIEAVLIIDSFYDLLNEETNELSDKTDIVYEFSIKEKINEIHKDIDVTKETFNVYVSGIDTFGSVTDQARSDVNIVASINPKTHEVVMINIPRDYYVELDGVNQKDKLTHAGIYGVEMSTKTIENLLDIEINYYVKVNFNAVIKTVDALGGVEVYSNYNFYSTEYSHRFVKGYNKVDGDLALDFVRTRKAFLDGDRVRGENQQAMIEAIVKKASSPDILMKYDDILDTLEGCFTTNLSTDKIMDLVKMQLDSMPSWNITSIGLNGSDSYGLTYTYPHQELYVMIPNEETIKIAKDVIDDLKENTKMDSEYKKNLDDKLYNSMNTEQKN